MCWGSRSQPDSGQAIRQQEEERQARVRAASSRINTDFSKFDPAYYGKISQSVRDYYFPQVDEQFRDANRATTFRFADNAGSSAAARTAGELQRDYGRAKQDVELKAQAAGDAAKRDVESQRSRLITLAEAGGTLENVASQSAAAVDASLGRPTFEPITDFFRKYTANLGNAALLQGQGYSPSPFWATPVNALRTGAGNAVRYVGS